MPVNDAPNFASAEINCALCCVAGVVGTTAETERLAVLNSVGINPATVAADATFVRYIVHLQPTLPQRNGADMISNQVLGVQTWLVRGHNMVVNALGSTANPFQLDVLRQNMMQQPMGTAFIVLLLDWDDEWNGGTATAAHWTVARRQGGGFDYTDYQLDVDPLNRDGMRRQVQRLNAPFGAPSVTNQPMEAFGDPSQATNRYMALAIAQPAPAQGGGGGGGGSCGCLHCYITTAACSAMGLPDDCQELTALRRYRDAVLLTTERGAAEVAEYYATAPSIVAALDKRDDAAAIYRVLYHQHIRPAAVAAEAGEYQTAYRLFRAGVARAAALAAEETDPG